MTWNYNVGQLNTSTLMRLRYIIGDTQQGDQLLQDEELTSSLGNYSNIYSAGAEACRAISQRFARQVDTVQGQLKTNYSQRSKQYFILSLKLEQQGLRGAVPVAGGISNSDKQDVASDPDRVPPAFNRSQFDDLLPTGPVGEQTPGAPPLPDQQQSFP